MHNIVPGLLNLVFLLQTPEAIQAKFEESFKNMSKESSKALNRLAVSIKTMIRPSTVDDSHSLNAKRAADNLKSLLKTTTWEGDVLEIISVATVATLLIEVVSCTVRIAESVQELASLAKFKTSDEASKSTQINNETVKRTPSIESHNATIEVE